MHHRLAVAATLLLAVSRAAASDGLTADEFHRLFALLTPAQEEIWKTIPWKTSLLDAQREAAEADKPIFIWAMDGHPLGCT